MSEDYKIRREHVEKTHVEVVGPSQYGKSTVAEWVMSRLLQEEEAGLLLIDPLGDSYRKYIGWLTEGIIQRPAWLVDLDEAPLRYNPLQVAKKNPSAYIPGLYEALTLIHSDSPAVGQHREMRRHVMATLHALIDNDLPLTAAAEWLQDEDFKTGKTFRTTERIYRIRDLKERAIWKANPSKNELRSTVNWFDAFGSGPLNPMFSGNGFNWDEVYPTQAMVLVNLSSQNLGDSELWMRGLATMFINGLHQAGFFAKEKYRWYAVIDDAQFYTPPTVGKYLLGDRHFDLYYWLIHHFAFPSAMQNCVDQGCTTKFFFGDIPHDYRRNEWDGGYYRGDDGQLKKASVHHWFNHYGQQITWPPDAKQVEGVKSLPKHECLYVAERQVFGRFKFPPTPKPDVTEGDIDLFKDWVYSKPEYGVKAEPPESSASAVLPKVPPPLPSPGAETVTQGMRTPNPRGTRRQREQKEANQSDP